MQSDAALVDDETLVRALLAKAGVPATEEEIASVVTGYGKMKEMIGLLHAVPEARYASPGLHFNPTPTFGEWG